MPPFIERLLRMAQRVVVFLTLFPLPLHLPLLFPSLLFFLFLVPLFFPPSLCPFCFRLIKLGIQRPGPPPPLCFHSPLRGLLLSRSAFVTCGRRHKARVRHGIIDKRDDDERAGKLQWPRWAHGVNRSDSIDITFLPCIPRAFSSSSPSLLSLSLSLSFSLHS